MIYFYRRNRQPQQNTWAAILKAQLLQDNLKSKPFKSRLRLCMAISLILFTFYTLTPPEFLVAGHHWELGVSYLLDAHHHSQIFHVQIKVIFINVYLQIGDLLFFIHIKRLMMLLSTESNWMKWNKLTMIKQHKIHPKVATIAYSKYREMCLQMHEWTYASVSNKYYGICCTRIG